MAQAPGTAALNRMEVRRGPLRLACWTWGVPRNPPIVMVHGWGDTGASFQFVADFLADDFYVVAPDLRGFGESEWAPGGYWFPDYLADLDAVTGQLSAEQPLALVGHSMGGNIAGLLAGVRAERFSHLVLLEGFGLPPTQPAQAPERYRRWLNSLHASEALRDFASEAALHQHLRKLAPRTPPAALQLLARQWARPVGDAWRLKMDPAHKRINPVLYRREEAAACWAATTAPVLLVGARDSDVAQRFPRFDIMTEMSTSFRNARHAWVDDAGHMLHWEQPARVAQLIREFISRETPAR